MSVRVKSMIAVALLALAACTPPPETGGYGYSPAPVYEQPYPYQQPYDRYDSGYRGGYGGADYDAPRGDLAYGRVIGADRVGGGGGRGNDLAAATIGGLAGGLVGNQIGDGSGRDIATAVGAVGGALAGRRVASSRADPSRIRWTIRLDDGLTVRVVQDTSLAIGQRVAISWRDGEPQIVG